jgi:hypothetical protein
MQITVSSVGRVGGAPTVAVFVSFMAMVLWNETTNVHHPAKWGTVQAYVARVPGSITLV